MEGFSASPIVLDESIMASRKHPLAHVVDLAKDAYIQERASILGEIPLVQQCSTSDTPELN